MARKLELHGYYFDGKQMYIMYIDQKGKIIMKKEKLWMTNLERF